MRPLACALILPMLMACSNEANHLGNPITWPAVAVGSAVSNAVYDSRRAKVSTYVAAHQPAILAEAAQASGPHLLAAMELAQVPASRQRALTQELAQNPLYARDREALVVALMVHGV